MTRSGTTGCRRTSSTTTCLPRSCPSSAWASGTSRPTTSCQGRARTQLIKEPGPVEDLTERVAILGNVVQCAEHPVTPAHGGVRHLRFTIVDEDAAPIVTHNADEANPLVRDRL